MFERILGQGDYGLAVLVIDTNNPSQRYVLKMQMSPKVSAQDWIAEFKKQREASRYGLAVRPFGMSTSQRPFLLTMSKIDAILYQKLKTSLTVGALHELYIALLNLILRSMCKFGVDHRDMHLNNIGLMYNIETRSQHAILLDFGSSSMVEIKKHGFRDCRVNNLLYVNILIQSLMRDQDRANYAFLLRKLRVLKTALKNALASHPFPPLQANLLSKKALDDFAESDEEEGD